MLRHVLASVFNQGFCGVEPPTKKYVCFTLDFDTYIPEGPQAVHVLGASLALYSGPLDPCGQVSQVNDDVASCSSPKTG